MAIFHGKDGHIALLAPSGDLTAPTTPAQTNLVGNVQSWSLTVNQDIHDSTQFADEFRRFTQGLKSWTADVEAQWDAANAAVNQDELWETLMSADFGGTLASNAQVQVNLYVDAETAGANKKCYYGAAYVENAVVSVPVGDVVTVRFSLRGNGTLKFSAVAN